MTGLHSANAPGLDLPARFMALSIAALAVFAVISPWALPLVQGSFSAFPLLALVHLLTLGFIGAMIIGASYQLVPVAIQVQLSSARLGRVSFWFYLAGLALFLPGLWQTWLLALAAGATLLGVAFVLYIGIIFTTWWRSPHKDVVAWHIAIACVHAGIGMVFGVLLAVNASTGILGDRLLRLLAAHIVMMLVGWVALTFTGVAIRLIGMFTLAEAHLRPGLAWLELGLVTAGVWTLALDYSLALPAVPEQIGAVLLLAGSICFAVQMRHLYRNRMRRVFDIHIPFAVAAALAALVAALLLVIGTVRSLSPADPVWVVVVWLGLAGMAGTAIQGFFYKIATFLVWLHRYAPVAGREAVPKLEDLYNRRVGVTGWGLWVVAVVAGAIVMLAGVDVLSLIALVLLGGVTCFVINVVLIARHWSPRTGGMPISVPFARGRARGAPGAMHHLASD